MRLRPHRRIGLVALAMTAAALAFAACTNQVESPREEPAKTTSEVRREHRGPLNHVINAAIEHGNLTTEQHDAIVAIRDRVRTERHDRHATKRRLRASAIEIVRSGTADTDQFDATLDEAIFAVEQRMRITSQALVEVHDLLEPEQRGPVAEALRAKIAEKFERRAKRMQKRKRFEKVAGYLMLTPVQVVEMEKLREKVTGDAKTLRPTRNELDQLVDAFERDDFALAVETFQADRLKRIRVRASHLAGHADAALSLLTDDQRELLAELIETGPEAAGLKKR